MSESVCVCLCARAAWVRACMQWSVVINACVLSKFCVIFFFWYLCVRCVCLCVNVCVCVCVCAWCACTSAWMHEGAKIDTYTHTFIRACKMFLEVRKISHLRGAYFGQFVSLSQLAWPTLPLDACTNPAFVNQARGPEALTWWASRWRMVEWKFQWPRICNCTPVCIMMGSLRSDRNDEPSQYGMKTAFQLWNSGLTFWSSTRICADRLLVTSVHERKIKERMVQGMPTMSTHSSKRDKVGPVVDGS